MTFENVIGVIGCEFLGQNQLAFWILDRELAFVLAPFVRRSEAHDPGAIHRCRYLVDFQNVEETVDVEHAAIVVFSLFAE